MKNLTKLGFIFSVGTAAAFTVVGCSDDTGTTTTTGGMASGGMVSGGSASGGAGASTGGAGASTGGAGASTGGAGASTGGAGASTGGAGGGGGASGGSGGGKAGGGGGGAGGASGGSGGGGGGGGAPAASAGCMKACVGADSINTICAGETIPDTIKNTCLASCAKGTEAQVTCWNMHAGFAKAATGGEKTTHCGHASGAAPCSAWPAP